MFTKLFILMRGCDGLQRDLCFNFALTCTLSSGLQVCGMHFVFEPTQKDRQLHPKEDEGVLWYILKTLLGFRKYQ